MNKDLIKFVAGILTLLICIFIYYKNKTYQEYLVIVPNAEVSSKVRRRLQYTYSLANKIFSSSSGINANNIVATNANLNPTTAIALYTIVTGLDWVPQIGPSAVNALDGLNTAIALFNPSDDPFIIYGTTITADFKQETYPTQKPDDPANKIKLTRGTIERTTDIAYLGDPIELQGKKQLYYYNMNKYKIQRIKIICDNIVPRSLYVYIKKLDASNPQVYTYNGFMLNNLKNDIIAIDFTSA